MVMCVILAMSLTACGDSTTEPGNNSALLETLQNNKWISDPNYFTGGDNEHFWIDTEITTLYFTSSNTGIIYSIKKSSDTDLGSSSSSDYWLFDYTVSGNVVHIEDEDGNIITLDYKNDILAMGSFIYYPQTMTSEDWAFVKELGPETGYCGRNVTYSYDERNHTLKISGTGEMYDYTGSTQPWKNWAIYELTVKEGVTSIGANAFQDVVLFSINSLPSSLNVIGVDAFAGTYIESVSIPDNVTEIGDGAFWNCRNLEIFTLNENLEHIGYGAFSDCDNVIIYELALPEKLVEIEMMAFAGCTIKGVDFNENLQHIGSYAFTGITEEINIPNSVKTIGSYAFSGSFNSVTIGTGLVSLSSSAFESTASSGKMYVNLGTPLTVDGNVFDEGKENRWTLYVPSGCKSAYAAKSPWSNFKYIYEDSSLENASGSTGNEDDSSETADVTQINEQDANDYRRGNVSTQFYGDGSQSNPYLISSAADLRLLSDECRNGNTFRGCYFLMTNDIVVNSNVLNNDGSLNGAGDNFERWIPIGCSAGSYRSGFHGTFDGNGYSVSGIYINREIGNCGLFGRCGGDIKNLTLKDSYIRGLGAGCAGFVGIGAYHKDSPSKNLSISNCISYATVVGIGDIGGICGMTYNTSASVHSIKNCANYGKIINEKTGAFTGGICGNAEDTDIYNCYNEGSVSSGGNLVGGICGRASGTSSTSPTIINCLNKGDVVGRNYTGGICGSTDGSICLKNCVSLGNVACEQVVGAIVGSTKLGGDVTYNYYLETICGIAIGEKGNGSSSSNLSKTEQELKSAGMLTTLNNRAGASCRWIAGSDGYPTLDWLP